MAVELQKVCDDGIEPSKLHDDLVVFKDRYSPVFGMRTPFPSDGTLYFVKPSCVNSKKQKAGRSSCAFSLSSAVSLRVAAVSNDGRKVFVLFNDNRLGMVELDERYVPQFFYGPVKLKDEWISSIPNNAVTESVTLQQEFSKVYQNVNKLKPLTDKGYRLHFTIYDQGKFANFLSGPGDLALHVQRGSSLRLAALGLHETDIYRPLLQPSQTSTLLADGIRIENFGSTEQTIHDIPFSSEFSPDGKAGANASMSLRTDRFSYFRTPNFEKNQFDDAWEFQKRSKTISCKASGAFDLEKWTISEGAFHLHIFEKRKVARQSNLPPIIYFYGGPSAQTSRLDYGFGPTENALLDAGRTIVVPYTSSTIGAGFQTSSRFRSHFLQAVQDDAKSLNRVLNRLPNGQNVDLYAASFGAHSALTFLNLFPDRVRKVVLEVPFAKYRDPSFYRKTKGGQSAQREFFGSALGLVSPAKIAAFEAYLQSTYTRAANHGSKIVVVSGSIDQKAPVEDIPLVFRKSVREMRVVKGDHMFAAVSSETKDISIKHLSN